MTIHPGQPDGRTFYQLLVGAVAPRPIALASTLDAGGLPNLSPFSFFNCFGSNPPMLVFSPLRRVRNNTTKDTLDNVHETMEVVINVVNHDIVHQTSLASCEYSSDVDEFVKSGLTPVASELVRPFRVKESPVSFECRVTQVIRTGMSGGAGNLILCEILLMHIQDGILDPDGRIDPHRIDLVGRMGFNFYCRASGAAVFEVPKPTVELGIGLDRLPVSIRHSRILSGNDLAMLGGVTEIPAIDPAFDDPQLKNIFQYFSSSPEEMETELHRHARDLLASGEIREAWQVLLSTGDGAAG